MATGMIHAAREIETRRVSAHKGWGGIGSEQSVCSQLLFLCNQHKQIGGGFRHPLPEVISLLLLLLLVIYLLFF